MQIDSSHTLAKNGGNAVGYQNQKSTETVNTLFVVDNQRIILVVATLQDGNHHDLYQIRESFDEICTLLK